MKPTSPAQLRRYIRALEIKPIGARQRPQRYPDETAGKILKHLGFEEHENGHRKNRIPTINQLRNERAKAQKAHRRAA